MQAEASRGWARYAPSPQVLIRNFFSNQYFLEYCSFNLYSCPRLLQQTSENINTEVLDKLAVKNKEVRALIKITEEKEFELCKLCQQLKDQECKYTFLSLAIFCPYDFHYVFWLLQILFAL